MKTISFDKLNFQNSDILSRLQKKRIKGGHQTFCECTFESGPGQWHYIAHEDLNTPAQPPSQAIMDDLSANCDEGMGSCTGCTNFY